MKVFVTGAAGFIASNLVDRLLADGHDVVGYDNFSTGRDHFLKQALPCARFQLHRQNLLDLAALQAGMDGADLVVHLAANADVRFGLQHPTKDLEQNTIATSNVLEAMRATGVKKIAFASTGSVYGEATIIPTPEDSPFPVQTSLYAASKLAAEALIEAYCEGFGFQGYIFRFVSILGERYSHGHVFDFYRQLLAHPGELKVLGNGLQRKSYLYVQDCVNAILLTLAKAQDPVTILNLGTDEYCQVNDSIGWICDHLQLKPRIDYGGGDRGWVGDNPFIFLDCSRMRALGWRPKLTIREAIVRTLQYLEQNQFLLEPRA
jgi:UDP-glucose 4-epimerase